MSDISFDLDFVRGLSPVWSLAYYFPGYPGRALADPKVLFLLVVLECDRFDLHLVDYQILGAMYVCDVENKQRWDGQS